MSNIIKEALPVLNIRCAGCANNVGKTMKKLVSVVNVSASFAIDTLSVSYEVDELAPGEIHAAILAAGYDPIVEEILREEHWEEAQEKHYRLLKRQVAGAWIFVIPILLFFMVLMHVPFSNEIRLILALLVMIFLGGSFYVNAWWQARLGRSNMDTLVTLSISVALLSSVFSTFFPGSWYNRGPEPYVYYEIAVVVTAFALTSKLMEERTKGNTSTATRKLMGLQPRVAHALRGGVRKDILVDQLQAGDLMVVRLGEQIPVDGRLPEGESCVDEDTISGEPTFVEEKAGGRVLAETIDQKGSFVVETLSVGSETVLAHIIRMVQEVQGNRTSVQCIVDRVTEIFVPVVLCTAVLTFVIQPLVGGTNYFSRALLSAVSVLIIACPCVLGLITPTALMVGIDKAAGNHILIEDAVALEQMRKVDVVVLNKTGALTEGHSTVSGWLWAQAQEEHFKNVLSAAELKSEHPLAKVIVSPPQEIERMVPAQLDSFESVTGKGIKAVYQEEIYWVGSHKLLKDFSASLSDMLAEMMAQYELDGNSTVHLDRGNKVLVVIVIASRIKPASTEAVKELKRQEIDICMLTGDGQRAAFVVSGKLDTDRFVTDALPDDKKELVRELQMQGKVVAMVGGEISDSQTLAPADVSIAMGKRTDIAMDVAMVMLMTSDLLLLPRAFELSGQTVKPIRRNLLWALIYNLIGIPITADILFPINGLLLSLMSANVAAAFSSVSAVLNSLSLARK